MKARRILAEQLPPRLMDMVASAEREAWRARADFGWDPGTGRAAPNASQSPRDPRSVSVVLAKGGKSLFHWLQDPRVTVTSPGERSTTAPDIVVTTEPYDLIRDPASQQLPDEAWARLRTGEARLLIDSSGEGYPFDAGIFLKMREAMRAQGVERTDYVYVTQDRRYPKASQAHRRSHPDEPEVTVLVHDRYIQYLLSMVGGQGRKAFRRRVLDYAAAPAQRGRRFISLNNKFRPARLLFLLALLRDGLWDQGHISVGPFDQFAGHELSLKQVWKKTFAVRELRPLSRELLAGLDQLTTLAPQYVGLDGAVPTKGGDRMMVVPNRFAEYADSWFTVVTETDFSDRLHRITEKPFKPLLCLHPFIVLGSRGSLRLIRDYGFKTFPSLFDEGYDEERDPLARFEAVYEQVGRLCRMDEAELARASDDAAEAMVFNAWWGLAELPALFRERIDAVLVDRLIGLAHGPAN